VAYPPMLGFVLGNCDVSEATNLTVNSSYPGNLYYAYHEQQRRCIRVCNAFGRGDPALEHQDTYKT
ncbi:MAG: hypothetical protein U9N87_01060, partial [Planctomycetota bacterium]|nr:hypothetical protein [Planctomycetota bacterium]